MLGLLKTRTIGIFLWFEFNPEDKDYAEELVYELSRDSSVEYVLVETLHGDDYQASEFRENDLSLPQINVQVKLANIGGRVFVYTIVRVVLDYFSEEFDGTIFKRIESPVLTASQFVSVVDHIAPIRDSYTHESEVFLRFCGEESL